MDFRDKVKALAIGIFQGNIQYNKIRGISGYGIQGFTPVSCFVAYFKVIFIGRQLRDSVSHGRVIIH